MLIGQVFDCFLLIYDEVARSRLICVSAQGLARNLSPCSRLLRFHGFSIASKSMSSSFPLPCFSLLLASPITGDIVRKPPSDCLFPESLRLISFPSPEAGDVAPPVATLG